MAKKPPFPHQLVQDICKNLNSLSISVECDCEQFALYLSINIKYVTKIAGEMEKQFCHAIASLKDKETIVDIFVLIYLDR